MAPTPLIAKNIDEVLVLLEHIIKESEEQGSRLGFFAALYHKVTYEVKVGIENGQFANGPQLAQLDVLFANRYFHALEQWKAGKPVSRSWQVAFESSKMPSKLVLQHLLLGINAHINLDLGIATVEAAAGGDIDGLRSDFNAINTVLSSLTYSVFNKLNLISPLLSFLGFTGTRSNSMLVQFSIGNARDGSWCFAEDLSRLSQADAEKFVLARDQSIAELGATIVHNKGWMALLVWLIHLLEWKNVRRIIGVLHTYKKPYKWDIEQRKAKK